MSGSAMRPGACPMHPGHPARDGRATDVGGTRRSRALSHDTHRGSFRHGSRAIPPSDVSDKQRALGAEALAAGTCATQHGQGPLPGHAPLRMDTRHFALPISHIRFSLCCARKVVWTSVGAPLGRADSSFPACTPHAGNGSDTLPARACPKFPITPACAVSTAEVLVS